MSSTPLPAKFDHADAHHTCTSWLGDSRFMVTSQAKPAKIIGQTNFNKVNAPHNVPVTERNGIFPRVLFPRILLYSFME